MRYLLLLLAIALVLAVPIALAEPDKVYIHVVNKTEAVAGVPLAVYQDGKKVAEATTNSTGWAVVDIDTSKDFTVIITLATGEYALKTFKPSDIVNGTVEYNLTTLHKVRLLANLTYSIPVIVSINATKLNYTVNTNATIYMAETVTIIYPKEHKVELLRKAVFKKLTYDTSELTEPSLTITVDRDYDVMGYYQLVYVIPVTYFWFVAIGIAIIFIVALAILMRAGAKSVASTRRVKYV
ncbi:MAG: hypothetical protein DRJ40_08165 [Thermoprotei archaeon]|nr:MAG: hypothetical protein DRJ40_08165 [Thermoprotei archaeon]